MMRSTVAVDRPALEALTGLRFVAAMAVVLYHAFETLSPRAEGYASRLVSHGYLGVSLFFVLSGFILTYTYIDPESGALRGAVRDFWWARVARIYPVYGVALVLALPVFVLYRIILAPPAARAEAVRAFVLAPTLLQAWWPSAACQWNCPGWSLSVEVFLYAIFPVVAVAIARSGRSSWLQGALSWVACLLIPLTYVSFAPEPFAHPTRFDQYVWLQAAKFNPVAHVGEFTIGIVAGLSFVRRKAGTFAAPALGVLTVGTLVIFGVAAATSDHLPYLFLHDGLLAPLWAASILFLAASRGLVARALASRAIVRLGEASYALYLVHVPVLGFVVLARGFLRIRHPGWTVPSWLPFVAYLLVSIGLSLVLFQRLEQPARNAIRRWRVRGRWPSPALAQRGSLEYIGPRGE